MTSLDPAPAVSLGPLANVGDAEFTTEVKLSLERAFAEGHSVDNAAVELKTLRMASNVPIARVREAVVGSIVDRIKVVEGNPAQQRAEITTMIGRWGELITKIGGVDAVETISILQVCQFCVCYREGSLLTQLRSVALRFGRPHAAVWSNPSNPLPRRHRRGR